jgi:hypothetical protein
MSDPKKVRDFKPFLADAIAHLAANLSRQIGPEMWSIVHARAVEDLDPADVELLGPKPTAYLGIDMGEKVAAAVLHAFKRLKAKLDAGDTPLTTPERILAVLKGRTEPIGAVALGKAVGGLDYRTVQNVCGKMRRAGLIRSVRGPEGGYLPA